MLFDQFDCGSVDHAVRDFTFSFLNPTTVPVLPMLSNKLTLFPILIIIILLYSYDEVVATVESKPKTDSRNNIIVVVPCY
ncbi:MAG: hypothetical protein CBD74_02290 [Saprospirales bacterium TMED214]|nr:MAG: hypothetical protein CBD74_02290 [Saprospirales bacterium TMED214]